MMQVAEFKSGAWTVFEKIPVSGMYLVKLYGPTGDCIDKVRCDDYRMAREYLAAFKRIAKAS